MDCSDYRYFFHSVKPFVKFNYFLDLAHIKPSHFSRWLNYNADFMVREDKINILYHLIIDELAKTLEDVNKKIA